MLLIGISGKKRSGKDTVARFLMDYHRATRGPAYRRAFGDALKAEISKATGCSVAFMDERKHLFRPIYQWWGTTFRREIFDDPYYWVDKLWQWLRDIKRIDNVLAVIPDVRFREEAEFVLGEGGCLIRVERRRPLLARLFNKVDRHRSETELDDYPHFHYRIYNNSTLENLEAKTMALPIYENH